LPAELAELLSKNDYDWDNFNDRLFDLVDEI
jgi:hypothetical protein